MQAIDRNLRERREAIVREHIEAENQHDVERTLATFHHPRYEVAAFGGPNDGAASVHDLLSGMFSAFPDLHVSISHLHAADEAVVVECVMTATHQGHFAELAPTGRNVALPMAAIFVFEQDRLLCERLYFDMATLMRQLQD